MDTIVSFTYTTISDPLGGSVIYKLYVDGKLLGTNSNPDVTAFIAVLSVGFHSYEILAFPSSVKSKRISKAAGGQFEVIVPSSPTDNRFIVGTTGNYYADAIIQYVLNFFDTAAGYANYAIDNTLGIGVTWLVNQFTNQGAPPSSSNYNAATGGYKSFGGTGSSFSDNYPIGSQVHVEIKGDNGGVNVVDFVAGQLDTPNPVTLDIPFTELISNIVATEASGIDPPSNQIGIVCGSDTPPTDPVTIQFQGGPLHTFPGSAFFTSPQTFTSGPLFDFFYSMTSGTYIYFITDPTGQHIQARGTINFAAHE